MQAQNTIPSSVILSVSEESPASKFEERRDSSASPQNDIFLTSPLRIKSLCVLLLLTFTCRYLFSNSTTPPLFRSGAPGEPDCSSCHSEGGTSAAQDFAIAGMPSAYVPGQTYNFTITASSATGFEISAKDSSDYLRNWSAPGTGVATDGQGIYVYQTAYPNSKTWTTSWTAPASGSGNVTFYIAGSECCNASPSGKYTFLNSFTAIEAPPPPQLNSITPVFGSVSETVTLQGINFGTSAGTVTFNGGFNAQISIWNNTQIIAMIPAGATTGNVTVKTISGVSNGLPFTVTGRPSLSQITPPLASPGTALSFTVTGDNFSKALTFKITNGLTDIVATGINVSSPAFFSGTMDLAGTTTGYWTTVIQNPDSYVDVRIDGFEIQVPPSVPVNLSGTPQSTNAIQWEWNGDLTTLNTVGYRLYTNANVKLSPDLGPDTTSYIVATLKPNTTYQCYVQAFNNAGASNSMIAAGVTMAKPPANLITTRQTTSAISLSWNQNGNPVGTVYEVERSTDGFFPGATVAGNINGTTYIDPNLNPDTKYYYRIRAINHSGIPSDYTASISATTVAVDMPVSFTGVAVSSSSILWQWDDVATETFYRLYTSTLGMVAETSANVTTFTETKLQPNSPSLVRYISAWRNNKQSTRQTINGSNVFPVYTFTALPANVTPTLSEEPGMADVGWDPNNNPTGTLYMVELSVDQAFGIITASATTVANSIHFENLDSDTLYYVRISGSNRDGVPGNAGAPASFRTPRHTVKTVNTSVSETVSYTPLNGGFVELNIPPQSFSENVKLTMTDPEDLPPPSQSISEVKATAVAVKITLNKALQPLKPIPLIISYSDSMVVKLDESRLFIARFDPQANLWIPITSTPDPANNRVIGITDHFSLFQLMESQAAPTIDGAFAYPNPFIPSKGHDTIRFTDLAQNTDIKIYAITGELVRELTANAGGQAVWDGKNAYGLNVASGVYYALLKGPGSQKKTIKLAVLR